MNIDGGAKPKLQSHLRIVWEAANQTLPTSQVDTETGQVKTSYPRRDQKPVVAFFHWPTKSFHLSDCKRSLHLDQNLVL